MLVAGVDEVGRGPLIGDVVACAVILPGCHSINGLTDSKKLSAKRRNELSKQIKQIAIAWAIGRASPSEIDQLNILHASMLAMQRAVESLDVTPDHILVDGNRLPQWQFSSEAIIKGDCLHEQISAASILAKVERDHDMIELDSRHPEYGFAKHKGYPTAEHLDALNRYGPIRGHRLSFKPVHSVLNLITSEAIK